MRADEEDARLQTGRWAWVPLQNALAQLGLYAPPEGPREAAPVKPDGSSSTGRVRGEATVWL